MRKPLTPVTGAAAVIALCAAVIGMRDQASDNDGAVASASQPPAIEAAGTTTDSLITFYSERVERDPQDFMSYTRLGTAYARLARETGSVQALRSAESALSTAILLRPEHPPAKAALATVKLSMHEFEEAIVLGRETYDADPGATAALATIGDAQVALGQYEDAAATYGELAARESGPEVDARLAHLAELNGDLDEAIRLMRRAEAGVPPGASTPETVAWFRTQLANVLLQAGNHDDAEQMYRGALEAHPAYVFALGGLARTHVARGDLESAIDLYEQAIAFRAEPLYEAALADIYEAQGRTDLAALHESNALRQAEAERATGIPHISELVLLRVDAGVKVSEAVELALQQIETRHDIYSYDAAAWALYRGGRTQEAVDLVSDVLRLGTRDANLYFHAGMIARAAGDDASARRYLREALAIDPLFSLTKSVAARSALAEIDG